MPAAAVPSFAPPVRAAALLVSDGERERTAGLLREHWVAGRLTLPELEARSQEAWDARYVPDLWRAVRELPVPQPPAPPPVRARRPAEAIWSLVLGVVGAGGLFLSLGLLFIVTLPLSVTGWALGNSVRRDPAVKHGRSMALTGEVLGAAGAVSACLALAACAAIVAAA